MTESVKDVYSFLIPMLEDHILIPNSIVAEIVPFMNVDLFSGIENNDSHHIGTVRWRNQQIPVVAIERVQGRQDIGDVRRSRIAILYTLNENDKVPYLAVMVQGIPRLVAVDEKNSIVIEPNPTEKGVKVWATVEGKKAQVPDLDQLEALFA